MQTKLLKSDLISILEILVPKPPILCWHSGVRISYGKSNQTWSSPFGKRLGWSSFSLLRYKQLLLNKVFASVWLNPWSPLRSKGKISYHQSEATRKTWSGPSLGVIVDMCIGSTWCTNNDSFKLGVIQSSPCIGIQQNRIISYPFQSDSSRAASSFSMPDRFQSLLTVRIPLQPVKIFEMRVSAKRIELPIIESGSSLSPITSWK